MVPYYKDEFNVEEDEIGTLLLFLGLGTVFGAIIAMLTQHCMPQHYPVLLGNFSLGVAVYLVAPVTHKGSLVSSVAALYATGVCHNLIALPMMPIIHAELIKYFKGEDEVALKDHIAVLFYFANSSG